MAVTPDDVRHVALLARLGIPESELAGYVEQLNGILAHMDALQRVPAGEPETGEGLDGMPLRDDRVAPIALAVAKDKFAPKLRDGFFLVPRLASHEDAGEES